MKLRRFVIFAVAGVVLAGARLMAADNHPTNAVTASTAVYVPDLTHQNDPLPDGVLAWNKLMAETTVAADIGKAELVFTFTNIATARETVVTTNITTATNVISTTNSYFGLYKKITSVTSLATTTRVTSNTVTRPVPVAILEVRPSCGCTTVQLPPLPWILPPGTNGQFDFNINLAGKTGMQVKTVNVKTDKGYKQLILKINILPPAAAHPQTEEERARALETARVDRQAVFRGDCAACHVKPGEGKYGKPLYEAVCGICHDSKTRASMVPDLHNLKIQTNLEFWQTWTAHGKAGTLMPAFSTADGGPLTEMQIASLANYLNVTMPSQPAANQ
jgi:mono/diheme cytochrome c family protein